MTKLEERLNALPAVRAELGRLQWQAWLTYYRLKWHVWRKDWDSASKMARLLLALLMRQNRLNSGR